MDLKFQYSSSPYGLATVGNEFINGPDKRQQELELPHVTNNISPGSYMYFVTGLT
jgi:hypothetical protein